MIDYSELYSEINYEEDYVGCFYAYKSETNHRRYKTNKINMFIKEVCGNVPHVYLVDNSGNTCRVKLLTNEYLRDEKDGDHPYSLPKLACEALNDYMHFCLPYKYSLGLNFWGGLCMEWNNKWHMGHEGSDDKSAYCKVSSDGVPDYTTIKEPK